MAKGLIKKELLLKKLDIQKLRSETPGCNHVLHFNNAGSALPPFVVVNSVKRHLDLEAEIGGYEAANLAVDQSEKVYEVAAKLINCNPDEIAFTDNATRAWKIAFYSFRFKKGDRILTCFSEFASNYLTFLHMAKRTGVIIEVIKDDSNGQLDLDDLKNKLDNDVKLIAITHVPTQGGLINPVFEVGKYAKQMNIPYLLDTTQSLGQIPIDVRAINCDFLCGTGRKYLRGPRGTGFLYARKSIIDQCDLPLIEIHSVKWNTDNEYQLRLDARRFETWEQNIAGKIGLATAIDYALQLGIPAIWERIQYLAMLFRKKLAELSDIDLRDLGKNKCGIVTFTSKRHTAEKIQIYLSHHRINVSISMQEHAKLDLARRNIDSLIRASVHYYNTEEEINRFCEILQLL
jgi:selenocysteine lyase/cysteine desulfurase